MNADLQPAVANIRLFPDGRLTAQDAAAYCGITYKTMALQRSQGKGPPFVKLGKAVWLNMDFRLLKTARSNGGQGLP